MAEMKVPTTRQDVPTSTGHAARLAARLAISWVIVGAPLVYGVFEAIKSIRPLFGG
jgi:hypothetical protein